MQSRRPTVFGGTVVKEMSEMTAYVCWTDFRPDVP